MLNVDGDLDEYGYYYIAIALTVHTIGGQNGIIMSLIIKWVALFYVFLYIFICSFSLCLFFFLSILSLFSSAVAL